jgi:hypothetical protein
MALLGYCEFLGMRCSSPSIVSRSRSDLANEADTEALTGNEMFCAFVMMIALYVKFVIAQHLRYGCGRDLSDGIRELNTG